jgi:hypothetical protein
VQLAAEGEAEFQDRCISHSASPPNALLIHNLLRSSTAPVAAVGHSVGHFVTC